MLRKSKIAAAILMASATVGVNAAHVNSDGTGQVAILPYYNTNGDFITNFTVTNTTSLWKAVKVRFRESRISADVLDFNIYLSPYDVWNATIRSNPTTGIANIHTEDETCTYPDKSLLQNSVDFRNIYTATTDEDLNEGYIEVIEMGVIADGADGAWGVGLGGAVDGDEEAEIDGGGADAVGTVTTTEGDRSIPAGLLHGSNGIPADCSVVQDAWNAAAALGGFTSGDLTAEGVATEGTPALAYDADNLNNGLVAPTGGINAYAILINVGTGAAFVEQGTHIEDYATVPQHYRSDDQANYLLPSLSSGDVVVANMLNAAGTGVKTATMVLSEFDTGAINDIAPNPSIPMGSNPFTIAAILNADAVSVPYFIESNVNGETDIVLTFPMRKHGVYNGSTLTLDLDGTGGTAACFGTLNDGVDDGNPTTIPVLGTAVDDYPVVSDGGAPPAPTAAYCDNAGYAAHTASPDIEVGIEYYDYEEQSQVVSAADATFSPVPINAPDVLALEREVNVVSLNRNAGGNQSVLGTPDSIDFDHVLDAGFEAGWVTISADAKYDLETNADIIALSEAVGGATGGVAAAGVWTGIPVVGFSAMAADVGPTQLGETVDLIRSTNR